MGGKLLAKQGARRISTEEYCSKYTPKLKELLEPLGVRFSFISFYREKESQGNINVLVNAGENVQEEQILLTLPQKNRVMSYLQGKGYKLYVNSDVVSFLFEGEVQVDLIFTPTSKFSYSEDYFSWNDLGGLIGRVARSLGLTHGHKGLYYKLYNEDRSCILGTFLITDNPEVAFKILGYDYSRFKKGFNTLEEIFEYATSSPFFSTKHYHISSMTSADRGRDAKRVTFVGFETYLKENNVNKNPDIDKKLFLETLFTQYPAVRLGIVKALQKQKEQQEIALKFNGNIVQEISPDTKGPALGSFIASFKQKYSDKYLLESTPEQIREDIKSMLGKTAEEKRQGLMELLSEEERTLVSKALYTQIYTADSRTSTKTENLYKIFVSTLPKTEA